MHAQRYERSEARRDTRAGHERDCQTGAGNGANREKQRHQVEPDEAALILSSLIMLSASKTATRAFVQMIKRCVAGLALGATLREVYHCLGSFNPVMEYA
jgi:hypothetical protein